MSSSTPSRWARLSTTQKVLLVIGCLLLWGLIANSMQPSPQAPPYPPYGGYPPQAYARDGMPVPMPMQGVPGNAYSPQGMPMPMPGGAYGGDGQMAAWQAQQDAQSRGVAGFNEYINGTATIQDNSTGQVYGGVAQPIADGAIDSGAYSAAPATIAGDP